MPKACECRQESHCGLKSRARCVASQHNSFSTFQQPAKATKAKGIRLMPRYANTSTAAGTAKVHSRRRNTVSAFAAVLFLLAPVAGLEPKERSEERRVGKGWRCRWG